LISSFSLLDWGSLIHSWSVSSGLQASISTLYEISVGSLSRGQPWFGFPFEFLYAILSQLSNNNKCLLIQSADPSALGETGIKFKP